MKKERCQVDQLASKLRWFGSDVLLSIEALVKCLLAANWPG